jgi:hypothetical protein
MSRHLRPDPGLALEILAYSGGRGEEEPRALRLGGERVEVREVLARWKQPSGRFFRVATEDGHVHELFCREADLSWWLVVGGHPLS